MTRPAPCRICGARHTLTTSCEEVARDRLRAGESVASVARDYGVRADVIRELGGTMSPPPPLQGEPMNVHQRFAIDNPLVRAIEPAEGCRLPARDPVQAGEAGMTHRYGPLRRVFLWMPWSRECRVCHVVFEPAQNGEPHLWWRGGWPHKRAIPCRPRRLA